MTQIFDLSIDKMRDFFDRMRNEAGWDTAKEMYWGFYFLDHNMHRLKVFSERLKKEGFQVVEMRSTPDYQFLLHAEHHGVHSAPTLFKQCQSLAKLASEYEIELFDGWDVEEEKLKNVFVE